MLRYVTVLVVILGLIAILTRSPLARRALWVMGGLAILYTLLKLTGVIEAVAPDRSGVF
jgi:threonine/homoserine/homoserine lactone efflux protein